MRTIACKAPPQSVKHFDRKPFRVGCGLHQDRRHGTDEYGFGKSLCAMAPDVAGNFTSACGVTHHCDLLWCLIDLDGLPRKSGVILSLYTQVPRAAKVSGKVADHSELGSVSWP